MAKRFILILLVFACNRHDNTASAVSAIVSGEPVKVVVQGYNGNLMEPFISRDGHILLFNNLNAAPENTNLHWAIKINDSTFQYQGEITGVNTTDLEGVPTMDTANHVYFVSTRDYANTLSTLYQGNFSDGAVTNVQLVAGVSKRQAGWVNFDVEVSADGQQLYFVDAQFDQSGNPKTADLVIAAKNGAGFARLPNTNALLANINTDALEYAACISANGRALYFTRVSTPLSSASLPEIFVATRSNNTEPFSEPVKIAGITGFAEAPSIAPDQQTIYYHKKENNKFVLYMLRKK